MASKILYLLGKQKYNKLINMNTQRGGNGGSYDKTIVLSCTEFNSVVDNLIALDSKNGSVLLNNTDIIPQESISVIPGIQRTLSGSTDSKTTEVSLDDIKVSRYLDRIKELDDKSKVILSDIKFHHFLEDTLSIKVKDLITEIKSTKGVSESDTDLLIRAITKKLGTELLNEYMIKYMRKQNNYETTNFFRGFINWKKYSDLTPDIKMNKETVTKLRGAKVIYFAYFSFNEPDVTPIIDQLLFLNSLSHYGVGEINIVLPYFPVGTMERIVGEGEIPTGYSLAHLLNSIPSGSAKNKIFIYDIHALCSRFFFHTNTNPILITMMPKYTKYIKDKYNHASDLNIIVFPDDGAKKRYDKLIPNDMKKILCSKTRQGDERVTRIEEGLENLKDGARIVDKQINLFLIDDLVQSGGTILEAYKGIKKQLCELPGYNNEKIKYIPIITHSIFPNDDNVKKFFGSIQIKGLDGQQSIDGCDRLSLEKLITTNSRPNRVNKIKGAYEDKIEIIDIAESFYDVYVQYEKTSLIAPYSVL